MHFRSVFITVGTTEFDHLINSINNEEFINILKSIGCEFLTIQYGNGCDFEVDKFKLAGIAVTKYRLKNQILEDIKKSDLIVSHAGAGTCMEVLKNGKPLVVVINEELMNNHQTELAQQLHKDGHLFYCTINNLKNTLLNSNFDNLKPYIKGDMSKFTKHLDILMGFVNCHEE